jgi:undecaprenyl-diphosphatase
LAGEEKMTGKIVTLWRRLTSEIGGVVALAVAAGGALLFIHVADEMREGDTRGFDQSVLLAIRGADRPAWVQDVAADITSLGGYAVLTLLVIGVGLYLVMAGKRGGALLMLGALISGAVLSEALKFGFARPRPDLVDHWTHAYSSSFPSGHAMLSAVAYLTLGVLLARVHEKRRVKALVLFYAAALTILIGLSRIYLGVHWPTDVIAGWALGAAWASLWWLAAIALQRAHVVEGEEDEAA